MTANQPTDIASTSFPSVADRYYAIADMKRWRSPQSKEKNPAADDPEWWEETQ
jgi:hypothetical protein